MVDDRLGGLQRLAIERQHTADKSADECIEFSVGYSAIDPAVTFGGISVEIVRTKDDLEGTRPANKHRQPLQRPTSWYQAGADLRLPEDGFLPAGEPDVASKGEFTATATNSSPYDGNAQNTTFGQPRRSIHGGAPKRLRGPDVP